MTVWLDEELLAALLKRAADEGITNRSEAVRAAVKQWAHAAPDIHGSARRYYAKDHLGDEDSRHAYGHVLNSRLWMIWTARWRAARASGE